MQVYIITRSNLIERKVVCVTDKEDKAIEMMNFFKKGCEELNYRIETQEVIN